MNLSLPTTRAWMLLAGFVCSAGPGAWGQDAPGQSLGDVARKTRKEHSSAAHLPGKQVANDDDDGPDASGVWRVRLCSLMPCYELSITLPRNPKWKRAADQPRTVLIPLSGHEQDPGRTIGVYAAESIQPMYSSTKRSEPFCKGGSLAPNTSVKRHELCWMSMCRSTVPRRRLRTSPLPRLSSSIAV
jgi:hypothetical protein